MSSIMLNSFNPPFNIPFIFLHLANFISLILHLHTHVSHRFSLSFISLLENSRIHSGLCIISFVNTSVHLSYEKGFFFFFTKHNHNTLITPYIINTNFLIPSNTDPAFRFHWLQRKQRAETHTLHEASLTEAQGTEGATAAAMWRMVAQDIEVPPFPHVGLDERDETWGDDWGQIKWREINEFCWHSSVLGSVLPTEWSHALSRIGLLSVTGSCWSSMVKLLGTSSLIS